MTSKASLWRLPMLTTAPVPLLHQRGDCEKRDRCHQNPQLGDITAWGRRWQVKFAPRRPRPWLYHVRGRTPGVLEGETEVRGQYPCHQGLHQHLGGEVDSRLRFDRQMETVARRASLRVKFPGRVKGPASTLTASWAVSKGPK
ncbi:hypothetical protein GWK47_042980 [Chionoecetes opilio]|uniref:Uncharacterized protein n=1 Tax=Chionoecetes opilio TaxID=41210 RepID=A0A8J4YFI0_CHIOP|nr:hypothetical protein GWK47_042980 [Chionoecetes opilio]